MIMRQGQQLLLPANPFFIWGSLLVALLLNSTIYFFAMILSLKVLGEFYPSKFF